MKSIGKSIIDINNKSIIGISAVLSKIFIYLKYIDKMVILSETVDKVLLIDSSLFNLYLAKKIKKKFPNKEIIYYILPQVWISRKGRVKKLEKYCDKLLGILPFEIDFYREKAEYIGHPLLDEFNLEEVNSERDNAIAYMAGSRKSEIKNLMPIFRNIREELSKKKAILIIPSSFTIAEIKEYYGDISNFEISRSSEITLKKSKFAFICSGTATLESSLLNTPFILIYILSKFDNLIFNIFLKKSKFGLANILLNKIDNSTLHKEFIGLKFPIEDLIKEYNNFNSKDFLDASLKIKKYLKYGSSKNVLKILEN